jgi:hypothetical protein
LLSSKLVGACPYHASTWVIQLAVFTVKVCVESGATADDDVTSTSCCVESQPESVGATKTWYDDKLIGAVHCVLFVRTKEAVPLLAFGVTELTTICPFDKSVSKSEAESVQLLAAEFTVKEIWLEVGALPASQLATEPKHTHSVHVPTDEFGNVPLPVQAPFEPVDPDRPSWPGGVQSLVPSGWTAQRLIAAFGWLDAMLSVQFWPTVNVPVVAPLMVRLAVGAGSTVKLIWFDWVPSGNWAHSVQLPTVEAAKVWDCVQLPLPLVVPQFGVQLCTPFWIPHKVNVVFGMFDPSESVHEPPT